MLIVSFNGYHRFPFYSSAVAPQLKFMDFFLLVHSMHSSVFAEFSYLPSIHDSADKQYLIHIPGTFFSPPLFAMHNSFGVNSKAFQLFHVAPHHFNRKLIAPKMHVPFEFYRSLNQIFGANNLSCDCNRM